MCTGQVPLASIEIITGRGNHILANGKRGVLRREIEVFLQDIGLNAMTKSNSQVTHSHHDHHHHHRSAPSAYTLSNPGRLVIEQRVIESWLQEQRRDDQLRSERKSPHGNMFLKLSQAKHSTKSKQMNIRAVCPFSSATIPSTVAS